MYHISYMFRCKDEVQAVHQSLKTAQFARNIPKMRRSSTAAPVSKIAFAPYYPYPCTPVHLQAQILATLSTTCSFGSAIAATARACTAQCMLERLQGALQPLLRSRFCARLLSVQYGGPLSKHFRVTDAPVHSSSQGQGQAVVTRATVAIRSPTCTAQQVHIESTHVSCYIMHRLLLDHLHSDLGPEHRAGLRLAADC